jgi:cell filamentation protein
MSKYQTKTSSIYIDGTSIPKNRFNSTDPKFIHTLEKKLLDSSYGKFTSELNAHILLNEDYFINLHKKTFESLYDFAGDYRDVNMSKIEKV